MKKQRMKRLMALSLTGIITVGALAGCGQGTGNGKGGDSQQSAESRKSAESSQSKETDAGKDENREIVEVNVWGHDMDFGADDRLVKYVEDKFGLKFNFTTYGWGIYQENLRTAITAGDLPDLFVSEGPGDTFTMYDQLQSEELLADMTDILPNYPNILASSKYDEATEKFYYDTEGRIFGVPRKWNKDTTDRTLFIRKDWLDDLGLKMPDTWDDVYEVLKAFKEAKPDGVEQVGLSLNDPFWLEMIITGFTGVNTWYQDETGTYKSEVYHPKRKEAFEYLHKLYSEGLLDPECYVSKADRPKEYFASGRSGIVYDASQYASCMPYFEQTKKNFPEAEVAIVNPIPASPDGVRSHKGIDRGYFGMWCFNKDFEHIDRVMEMMDWLASEEGNLFVRNGIEGVHYTMDGDKVVKNEAECARDQFSSNGVTSHYISYFTSIDFTFNQDMSVPYAADIFTPSNEIGAKYSARNPVLGFVYDDVTSQYSASMFDIQRSYESQFVTGQLSLDKWDEMIEKIKKVDNGEMERQVNEYMAQYK